jgi:hypothetical protein
LANDALGAPPARLGEQLRTVADGVPSEADHAAAVRAPEQAAQPHLALLERQLGDVLPVERPTTDRRRAVS